MYNLPNAQRRGHQFLLRNLHQKNIEHLKERPPRSEKGHFLFAALCSVVIFMVLFQFLGHSFLLYFHLFFVFTLSLFGCYASDFQKQYLQVYDRFLDRSFIQSRAFFYPVFSKDLKQHIIDFPAGRKLSKIGLLLGILVILLPILWLAAYFLGVF